MIFTNALVYATISGNICNATKTRPHWPWHSRQLELLGRKITEITEYKDMSD